jgi:hypothetical protein
MYQPKHKARCHDSRYSYLPFIQRMVVHDGLPRYLYAVTSSKGDTDLQLVQFYDQDSKGWTVRSRCIQPTVIMLFVGPAYALLITSEYSDEFFTLTLVEHHPFTWRTQRRRWDTVFPCLYAQDRTKEVYVAFVDGENLLVAADKRHVEAFHIFSHTKSQLFAHDFAAYPCHAQDPNRGMYYPRGLVSVHQVKKKRK